MTGVSFLTQAHNGKIGLSIYHSGDDDKTVVSTTYWLAPNDAAGLAVILLREVEALPRVAEASDLGLVA